MATPVMMPKQGQSVESCIISQWFKKKGDSVKAGDLLFSYETDKASFEEEAKVDGVLLEIFFDEGEEVPVLTNVAVIGQAGESTAEFNPNGTTPATAIPVPVSETVVVRDIPAVTSAPVAATGNAKIKVSPRARIMAEKKGIHLSSVKGTGPNGRIIVRDIEQPTDVRAAGNAQPVTAVAEQSAAGFEMKKLSNIRKLIAKAMHESLQNSAQLTHHLSADVRKLLALREEVKKTQKTDPNYPNITLNDMICWAVIRALEKNPEANSQFLGDSIKTFKQVHLGLAVDTPRGLMVPVLKNASDLSLKGLSNNLRALADGCRKGGIDPELLQSTAGSFTVSNLGNYGVEIFTPIINVPQVAILGVNTIVHRPADVGGGVMGFVPYIGLSLTYDHRAIDGGPATLFLKEIKTQIENFPTNIG
ncbi:MAG: 2-oxo acid dehydrogenase subunit E2 [Bacteroidales bacterium]|jgi:pyruvate dehydrogenase E2 component (dihydrolipoamide acetyltransferase)|nr:2-oxo acid dehydrogenase subunit E2 [Bacteroidales bacterium]